MLFRVDILYRLYIILCLLCLFFVFNNKKLFVQIYSYISLYGYDKIKIYDLKILDIFFFYIKIKQRIWNKQSKREYIYIHIYKLIYEYIDLFFKMNILINKMNILIFLTLQMK